MRLSQGVGVGIVLDSWCKLSCQNMKKKSHCELRVQVIFILMPLFTWTEILEYFRYLEILSRCFRDLYRGSTTLIPNSLLVHGIKWSYGNGLEEFSVEQLVQQILDSHQTKPAPRTHACLCSGGLG